MFGKRTLVNAVLEGSDALDTGTGDLAIEATGHILRLSLLTEIRASPEEVESRDLHENR